MPYLNEIEIMSSYQICPKKQLLLRLCSKTNTKPIPLCFMQTSKIALKLSSSYQMQNTKEEIWNKVGNRTASAPIHYIVE